MRLSTIGVAAALRFFDVASRLFQSEVHRKARKDREEEKLENRVELIPPDGRQFASRFGSSFYSPVYRRSARLLGNWDTERILLAVSSML
jgi:hypothetical protein